MIIKRNCVRRSEVEGKPVIIRISSYNAMIPSNLEPGDRGKCLEINCPFLNPVNNVCIQSGIFRAKEGGSHIFTELEFHPNSASK